MTEFNVVFSPAYHTEGVRAAIHQENSGDLSSGPGGFDFGLVFLHLVDLFSNLGKKIRDRLVGGAADPVHERVAGFCIQFDRRDAGKPSWLTVMLFLHQQVEFVEAIQGGSEFCW